MRARHTPLESNLASHAYIWHCAFQFYGLPTMFFSVHLKVHPKMQQRLQWAMSTTGLRLCV